MRASRKISASDRKDSSPGITANRLPPLKALVAFEAAARHRSFARGADELCVSPSAVSHHIQQLEEFLGIPLFERRAGRADLTSAGQTYAKEIEHALGLIAGATHLVAPQYQSESLVVASGPSFAAKWLQPRLCGYLKSNPSLKIRLTTLSDARDFDGNSFDIAICYGDPAAFRGLSEPLFTERLRPLCSPEIVSSLKLHEPPDLARATLIHSANALTWTEYLRRIGYPEVNPYHELWFDRSTLAIDAAIKGLGLVLESEILAGQELSEGRLVAPFAHRKYAVEVTTYFLVKRAGSRNRRQIVFFEKWLRAAIASANYTVES